MDNIYYTIAEQKMKILDGVLNEVKQDELEKILSRELQKIRLIPLDMFSAKEAINNIISAEIERNSIQFNRTVGGLMGLNLSTVTKRSKFRFDNYYKRFFTSRNRGFDFEGLIAGLLNGDISEDKSSPFDIVVKGNKISIKTLNNENESVVIKSISQSLKTYFNTYNGTENNKKELEDIFKMSNPIKHLVDSKNNDLVNVAEDVVSLTLEGIDSVLIGIPKQNNRIDLYYFNKEKIVKLATTPTISLAPKSAGSKQLRLSSSILSDADLLGTVIFPELSKKDYEDFLIGDEKTKNTIETLNKVGNKYGINGLGSQLPQDVIMDLAKSDQFITDMSFIIGDQKL